MTCAQERYLPIISATYGLAIHLQDWSRQMRNKASNDEIADFLLRTLPGKSKPVEQLRANLRDFAEDVLAKNLLLLGPVGIGKTTLARIVAVLRFLVVVRSDLRKAFLNPETLRFDRHMQIAKSLINWYE